MNNYAVQVKAKYNMWVKASTKEEAIRKAQEAFSFLETDYPEDTENITEIEKLSAYAELE